MAKDTKQSQRLDQPLKDWTAPGAPEFMARQGRYARLERLDADRHAAEIHRANQANAAIWDFLPYGPFPSAGAYHRWASEMAGRDDPRFYAVQDLETGKFAGVVSYLRINLDAGSIEVGHINFSPALQRTRAATEAMYLLMSWAFEAGYRRYEWKCDAQNIPSRRAAQRLGLSYEGIFRQASVVKGRNRDTAWYAAIDSEWLGLKSAFETWLSPENFGPDRHQIKSLSAMTKPLRACDDPVLILR